jgi:hypothetical protein
MDGWVALQRGQTESGCDQLGRALDLAMSMGDGVAHAEVLELASLLVGAKLDWQRDALLELVARLRAYWNLDEVAEALAATSLIGRLATELKSFSGVEPLMDTLAEDAIHCLETAAAKVSSELPADSLDWLLTARLASKECQRLGSAVTALRAVVGSHGLAGRRLSAHLIGLACRRGAADRAASLLEAELSEPLPGDAGLETPFETVAVQLLALLRDRGKKGRAQDLLPRLETWLLAATRDDGGDEAGLARRARLAAAAGEARTAIYLLRRRVSLLEDCEGEPSADMFDAMSDLFLGVGEEQGANLECLDIGRAGMELASQAHGECSEEASWWRGMLIFAHLRIGGLGDAADLAEEGAGLLPRMSEHAAQRTINAVGSVVEALDRQSMVRRAAQLRRYLGHAS